jgi:DNA-binding transcriptional regulator YiaG
MDKELMIKELAEMLCIAEDTMLNWEIGDIKPGPKNLERAREFVEDVKN